MSSLDLSERMLLCPQSTRLFQHQAEQGERSLTQNDTIAKGRLILSPVARPWMTGGGEGGGRFCHGARAETEDQIQYAIDIVCIWSRRKCLNSNLIDADCVEILC